MPLAGRVNDYGVGRYAAGRELPCGLAGVGADEFGVGNAVPLRVGARVLHGLGHYLRADYALGPLREAQAYRARAAVEVQHSPAALRQGVLKRLGVQPLGLGRVYLIERLGRELELKAAQPVPQRAGAPERAEVAAEDRIALRAVHALHHAGERRAGAAQRFGQRARERRAQSPARHDAAERRAVPCAPGVDVPHGAGAAVPGADAVCAHPVYDGPGAL